MCFLRSVFIIIECLVKSIPVHSNGVVCVVIDSGSIHIFWFSDLQYAFFQQRTMTAYKLEKISFARVAKITDMRENIPAC